MQQIKQTIWYIFTNNKIVLIIFSFYFFQINLSHSYDFRVENFIDINIYLLYVYTNSFMLGAFMALGLKQLSKTYIYVSNIKYKKTLMQAAGIIAIVYTLILFFILSTEDYFIIFLTFALAFSVIIYASIALLHGNYFINIFSIYFAMLIIYLEKHNLNLKFLVILIIFHIIVMAYVVYNFYFSKSKISTNSEKISSNNQNSNKSSWNLIDKIVILATKSKNFKKVDFAYCVLSPFAVLGFYGIFFIGFALLVVLLKDNISSLALIFNYASALIIIFLCLNAEAQLSQTTKLVQLYSNAQHKQLKNKILWSIDKSLLANSFSFYVILFLSSIIFSFTLDYHYLFISSLSILLFALAYYPLLIVLSAKKIVRIFPYLIYLIFCSIFIFKLFIHDIHAISTLQMIGFIVFCLILRIITQKILW